MARGRRNVPDLKRVVRDLVVEWGGAGSHLDRAAAALKLAEAADRFARAEIIAARENDHVSWTDVGEALGVTRQTAHERFRTGPLGLHSRLYKRSKRPNA